MIQHIDVHSVLQESSAGVYTDLVTRPTGRVVREGIQRVFAAGGGVPILARMDFNGVGCMDYSCADEIVARLVREWPAVLLLRNLTDGHREAIQPVLAAHGLAVLVELPDGSAGRPRHACRGRGTVRAARDPASGPPPAWRHVRAQRHVSRV